MIPILDEFVRRFKLDDFVLVADFGLINKKNVDFLKAQGYKYIIGARIKNTNKIQTDWILSQQKIEGSLVETNVGQGRLIVGYLEKRAKKDAYNRTRGLAD